MEEEKWPQQYSVSDHLTCWSKIIVISINFILFCWINYLANVVELSDLPYWEFETLPRRLRHSILQPYGLIPAPGGGGMPST